MSKGDGTGDRMSSEVGSSPAGRLWACHHETRSPFSGCPSMPLRKPSRPPGGGSHASIILTLRAATRPCNKALPGRWRRSTRLTRSCAIPKRGGCTARQAPAITEAAGRRRDRLAPTRALTRIRPDRPGGRDPAHRDRSRQGSTRVRSSVPGIRLFDRWSGVRFPGCRRVPGQSWDTSHPERRIPQDRCAAIAGQSWMAICRH